MSDCPQKTDTAQRVHTVRFGEISFYEHGVLSFPEGLPGFENDLRWILIGDDDSAIKWLQSCQSSDVALPVVPAIQMFPGYTMKILASDREKLSSPDLSGVGILLVLSVPQGDPSKATVNLKAPILVDQDRRRAFQVIVLNEDYSVRAPLMETIVAMNKDAEAQC
ncbi:MAG: flagellar assembly protein FliW [Dethiosulfovibrio peptidovorans]|nr:MAG: flagellar assembly protein FliW [Dethiosulfovibrio peptidovorans]